MIVSNSFPAATPATFNS